MRTFILGVGAQKAGTTWLSRQLSQSDDFITGLVKEYHLFDAQHLGMNGFSESNIIRKLKNFSKVDDVNIILKKVKIMESFYRDEKKYFDYFDSILKNDKDFTADITPSYSGLPSEVFTKIKNEFNRRDISVKVVFIIREPISRLESSIKMDLRRNQSLHSISHSEMTKIMHKSLNSQKDLLLSNYSYTCQQLEQVFSEEEIFYGFYETLFSEVEIKRLSAFLNMQPKNFDSTNVVNSSAKPFKYPLKDINQFKHNVQERYQFVTDKFNFDLSIWNETVSNMVDQTNMNFLERFRFNRGW